MIPYNWATYRFSVYAQDKGGYYDEYEEDLPGDRAEERRERKRCKKGYAGGDCGGIPKSAKGRRRHIGLPEAGAAERGNPHAGGIYTVCGWESPGKRIKPQAIKTA